METSEKHNEPGPELREKADTISLIDLLLVLVKRRWLIVGITGAAVLLIFGFLFYTSRAPSHGWNPMPNVYRPSARVLISSQGQGSSISSLLNQSGLGSISSLLGITGASQGGGTATALAQALLKNGSFIPDTIASEFDFAGKYSITKNLRTAARSMIHASIDSSYDAGSGILEIGYKDTDPVFATIVVNRIVELLDQQFKSLTLEQVRNRIQYLDETIADMKKESDSNTEKLVAFQKQYGIIDATGSASMQTETVTQIAQVQAKLFDAQVALKQYEVNYPENDSRIVGLKAEIAAYQKIIADLKAGSQELSGSSLPMNLLPEIAVQYLTLKRDTEISQAVLSTLEQQYASAKLQAADNSSTLQILERAEVPEAKFGPNRGKTGIIAAVAAFLISIFIAFVAEYFSRVRRDPVEGGKLADIMRMLLPWKRNPKE